MRREAVGLVWLAISAGAMAQLTWSTPVIIQSSSGGDNYHDTTPNLTVDGAGKAAIAFVRQKQDGSSSTVGTSNTAVRSSNVYATYSADGGINWSGAALLSEPAFYNSDLDASAGASGEFQLAWNSGDIFSEFRLHTSTTSDGGAAYTSQTVTQPFTDTEMGFLDPQIIKAADRYLLAKSSYNTLNILKAENPYIWSRGAGSTSWAEATEVTAPSAEYSHIGSVTLDLEARGTNLVATFRRDYHENQSLRLNQIMVLTSADGGVTWINRGYANPSNTYAGVAASLAGDNNGNWMLAWFPDAFPSGNDTQLHIQKSMDNGATWSSPATLWPPTNSVQIIGDISVATDGTGKWLVVFDAFNGDYDSDGDVLYTYSSDNGGSWSPVAPLNPGADTDAAVDAVPSAAYLGNDKWGVAWSRTEAGGDGAIVLSTAMIDRSDVEGWSLY